MLPQHGVLMLADCVVVVGLARNNVKGRSALAPRLFVVHTRVHPMDFDVALHE